MVEDTKDRTEIATPESRDLTANKVTEAQEKHKKDVSDWANETKTNAGDTEIKEIVKTKDIIQDKLQEIKNEKDPFTAKRMKKKLGLYDKFTVRRIDGTDKEGGKHENADYFVLDLTNDKFAVNALIAYEQACRQESWFALADDLVEKIRQLREPQAKESTN